jgi:branched-chain amino acid transport system ATP-binding protein
MLRVDDLRVDYGRIRALRGIDIEVRRGEIVAVIGPNGAGKSSLLNTISGAIKATSGSVTFEGSSIIGKSPEAIVRRGVSLVPEGRHIFTRLTVAENLQLGASARRWGKDVIDDVDAMLDLFPILRTYYRTSAGKLSGGEQQMLAIARALLARPRLLMLDEPSLGLAPILIDRVFDTLVELQASGVTILLVEQNATRAIDLADRTYVLSRGTIELAGSRKELQAHEGLEAAFLGFELAPLEREHGASG